MAQLRLCNSLRDSAPASFQHEVIALSEKVIVRLEDLVKWTVPDFSGWDNSLKAEPLKPSVLRELGTNGRREALHRYRESTLTSGLNFKDVQRERAQLGELRQRPQFLFSLLWGYFYYFPSFQKVTVIFPFSLGCCVECLCIVSHVHHLSSYVYCPLVGLTSVVLTGVIHQCIVGITPAIMS